MFSMKTNIIIVFSLTLGLSIASHAANYESIKHINELATDYITKNVSIDPDEKIEARLSDAASDLRLVACTLPIAVNQPEGSAGQHVTTLEMTCAGNPSWHVYVPIDMKIMTKVVVAKETIASNSEITADMVELGYRDKNMLYNGYYKSANEVEGKQPLATLVPGTVLTKKNTKQPILINRNQTVSIISGHGHVMVRAEGIAKTSGAINETIKVMNPSSKKVLDAVVINSSTVEVVAS